MTLPIKSFDELTSDQVAFIQSATTALVDFEIGTVNLSFVEANSSMGIWLEYLIDLTLSITRAATSSGSDLDSWMADYGLFRNVAISATGEVTFSRFVTTSATSIPVGSELKDSSFQKTFLVTKDELDPNYNPITNSYDVGIGTVNINTPVEAQVPGTQGNVLANTITVISSSLLNIDTVNNANPLANGEDKETDTAFRARFVLYINSLSRATKEAIGFAVESVPGVERFLLKENESFTGQTDLGFFYALIDDGTGSPPPSLLSSVSAKIEDYRGFTIAYSVFAPVSLSVFTSFTLTIASSQSQSLISQDVIKALEEYVNNLPMESILPISRLFEVIYDANSNILNVTNLLLNGSNVDLPSIQNQIFTLGTTTISYIVT